MGERAYEDSDAGLARALMRESRAAAFGTLSQSGAPFVSHVAVALSAAGAPLMLLSSLAVHSGNLGGDSRASLLYVRPAEPARGVLTAFRLTVTGRVAAELDPAARGSFLAAHPEAAGYAAFADFRMHRFDIEAGHLVAGFGRIVDLPPDALLEPTA